MLKRFALLLSILLMAVTVTPKAWGQLSNYVFQSGNGSQFDVSSGTVVFDGAGQAGSGQGGYDDNSGGLYAIGFTFPFAGTSYTSFSLSTNGAISLGNSLVTSTYSNNLLVGSYPMIAPFFDDLRVSGGVQGCGKPAISYQSSGVFPNRLLVIQYRDIDAQLGTPAWCTFQVRLYETGKIEFWYGTMNACDACARGRGCVSGSASIGLAASSSDYMSITLGTNSMSRVSVNNSNNINATGITSGTMFTFIPCSLVLTGRTGVGNGGTSTMANGDTFFTGFQTQVGSSSVYTPFSQKMTDVTCSGSCTLTISGAASGDYYFGTPGTLSRVVNLNGGVVDVPGITFQPTAGGVRSAVLTVSGPGVVRTFNLAARAPFVNYTGIIPQGGTAGMNTGDTLFKGIPVPRRGSQCFTPFSLLNVSGASQLVDYTLTDPTNQYTISADTTLGANGTTAPRICFSPQGFGPQPAVLSVTAGGDTRTFVLYAISAAPGADLMIGQQIVGLDLTELYRNRYGCVGEEAVTYTVKVKNTGYGDFLITGAEFYQVDTTYRQGTPTYPYIRDAQGGLVRSYDYWLTKNPLVFPFTAAQTQNLYPITVHQGDSTNIYLSFVGALNGKRFARAVVRTNGQSRSGNDTNGVSVEGVVTFDLYAHGSGAMLSDVVGGGLPAAVNFPVTHIGEWAVDTMHLVNNGVCSLRINLNAMAITSGDVDEFEIVAKPSSQIDATTNDLILPPGGSDQVILRFKPQQVGSRRAGLRLKTNDSNIYIPGITERGVYYVDLFGSGKTDLYGEGSDAGIALIGGGSIEHTKGIFRLKNTRSNPVSIVQLDIVGDDSTDFSPSNWPTLPVLLQPGVDLSFQVEFAPKAGETPGPRKTRIRMITSDGDTLYINVTGTAGTREIDVTPQDLKFGQLTIGKKSRRNVVVQNIGTMVLTVQKTPDMQSTGEYTATDFARTELQPGQSEIIEVTYAPLLTGSFAATMDIKSNATTAPTVTVTLNGTAKTQKAGDPDPTGTTSGPNVSGEIATSGLEEFSVAGVSGVRDASGMELMQSVPNPGRDLVEISYNLPARADVALALYDDQGRLVRTLDAGTRAVGETHLRIDVSGLAAGVYHYRLTANGNSLSRPLTIVR